MNQSRANKPPIAPEINVSTQVDRDGFAIVTIDMHDKPVNALDVSFAHEFASVLDTLQSDTAVKAIILVSGKRSTWIVGADIDLVAKCSSPVEAESLARLGQRTYMRIEKLEKPVVAAIHGAALGGGLELALACHARVLSDDPQTVLGFPEVKLGLLPAGNGLQRMARLVGLQQAMELGMSGRKLSSNEAKALGIADDVVRKSLLVSVAVQTASKLVQSRTTNDKKKRTIDAKRLSELAMERNLIGRKVLFHKTRETVAKETFGYYPAQGRIIDILEAFAEKDFDASSRLETHHFGELVMSETSRQLVWTFRTMQALKKTPYAAHPQQQPELEEQEVPEAQPSEQLAAPVPQPRKINQIGIVGCGWMGAAIAYISMRRAAVPVRISEPDLEGLARGYRNVHEIYDKQKLRGNLGEFDKMHDLSMLTGGIDYTGFGLVDIVIESVPEDLKLKRKVLAGLEQHCRPGTIFASNASALSITEISRDCQRPDQVVGMHYFTPAERMPLVEVVTTEHTRADVVATCVQLAQRQGKTVIVVGDGVGFYTSRILGTMVKEAACILSEGVAIEHIDEAMRRWGWPTGPIALLDKVGLDIALHVGHALGHAYGARMQVPDILDTMVADNRKGRKNKRGFYLYNGNSQDSQSGKVVDTSVYELLNIEPNRAMAAEQIQMRCTLQLVNEALRCLGEGVLRTPTDGDVGAMLGLGFPAFRGGPFHFTDAIGASELLRRIQRYQDRFGERWQPAPLLVERAERNKKFYL